MNGYRVFHQKDNTINKDWRDWLILEVRYETVLWKYWVRIFIMYVNMLTTVHRQRDDLLLQKLNDIIHE